MRSSILLVFLVLLGCAELMAEPDQVKISTSMGDIVIKLDAKQAPNSVKNFLEYVDAGYYDGSIFHRVIPGFMIQGGGFGPEMSRKDARASIQNEADNGLKNKRGSIAMARTGDPHSASAQFFINVADNKSLDHSEKSPRGWGYAVFGEVISGMEVVDQIVAVPRGNAPPSFQDVPKTTVLIKSATRVE